MQLASKDLEQTGNVNRGETSSTSGYEIEECGAGEGFIITDKEGNPAFIGMYIPGEIGGQGKTLIYDVNNGMIATIQANRREHTTRQNVCNCMPNSNEFKQMEVFAAKYGHEIQAVSPGMLSLKIKLDENQSVSSWIYTIDGNDYMTIDYGTRFTGLCFSGITFAQEIGTNRLFIMPDGQTPKAIYLRRHNPDSYYQDQAEKNIL